MDTQSKSSSVKGSSETSTESPKLKFKKRGRPSNADRAAALAKIAEAVKVTEVKKEKAKSGIKGAVVEKEEPVQKRKYTKKNSTETQALKEVSTKSSIVLEKTKDGTVEELKLGESTIKTVTLTEVDYNRLKRIESTVKELLQSAEKAGRYLGFGKNDKLPNTHESQEGKGVKALRQLVGMEKPGKGEPGDDVPF
jgi:hypothetical protein